MTVKKDVCGNGKFVNVHFGKIKTVISYSLFS
jgi:hypothetical protein